MVYSVINVSRLLGISIRTLHYYEEISLINPARNQTNNYREYSDLDILKIRIIIAFRESGYSLKDIKKIFNDYDNLDQIFKILKGASLIQIKHYENLKEKIDLYLENQ